MRRLTPAEFAVKGALTRLALFYQLHDTQTFTGTEIASFILSTWSGYEMEQDTVVGKAIREYLEDHETSGGRADLPAKRKPS